METSILLYIFLILQQFREFVFAFATYYGDIASLYYNLTLSDYNEHRDIFIYYGFFF